MSAMKIKIEVNADLEDIMPIFLERLRQDVLLIEKAIEKQDFLMTAGFAHRLRGNGPSYEIPELGTLGTELEKSAKGNNLAESKSILEKIKTYVERIEIIYK